MYTYTLHSLAHTEHFGRALAGAVYAHARVRALLLHGALGSGKTTLTRALVQALPGGNRAEISSPSFTLCHEYPTEPPVVHCDLYRTAAAPPDEVWEALDNPHTLTIVEWAAYLPIAALPQEYLDIVLESCQEKRLVRVTPHGLAAHALMADTAHQSWMTL